MDTMDNRIEEPTPQASPLVSLVACWLALAATIVCNGLIEGLRFNGVTTAEVSNQVFAWFAPAGYVFSIWAVIYAALIVWMVAMTYRLAKNPGRPSISSTQMTLFTTSCALNIMCLAAFHLQNFGLSLLIMVVLFGILAALYMDLRNKGVSRLELAPFSIYFAWSTVALIANATNLATRFIQVPVIVHQVSTVILVVAVLAVGVFSIRNSRDYVFPLVILWATIGIGVHLAEVDPVLSTTVFALTGIGIFAIYLPPLIVQSRAVAG